jgi:hypothetical protein
MFNSLKKIFLKSPMDDLDLFLESLLKIEEEETNEEKQEEMLLKGILPENVFTGAVFSNGQTALHLIMKSSESSFLIYHVVDRLLHLGVDSTIRDNDGILCTDEKIAWFHYPLIDKIYKWQLTRYPIIWNHDFVKKNKHKIKALHYYKYYREIMDSEEDRIEKAFNDYYGY